MLRNNREEILALKTDAEIQAYALKKGVKFGTIEREQRMYRIEKNQTKKETLADYLSRGKTIKEIANHFNKTEKAALKMVKKVPDGYEMFKTLNSFHQHIYVLLPKLDKEIETKPRKWTYAIQEEGQPYIWITLPSHSNLKKLKIVPIADLHYGSTEFKREKFLEYVNWISNSDEVYCFLNGDIFENCSGESNRGVSIFSQELTPQQQREDVVRLLSPIAHKILWAIPGNHENRSRKFDFDPLEYVANKLDFPYFQEPVYADVIWNDYVFTFFCQHGKSGSLTEGGKINAAARPLEFQEHTHFTVMAHVHDAKMIRPTRIVRDRVNFKLVEKKQYVVICPAFLEYFGSYAAKAVLKPGAWGTIACEIFRNGDYHAST